ncbi:sugar-transfer associated ATP-grasp domain-containing protein [Algibacter sp. L1A34]|uniref:sugar-transfer associated ATP-grasp domain-containing protein n=1 Tax=Algibacter sp. L1A34 TaxID=2686365 RepID=UPI00131B9E44|nr:sugar-transfer associated ATP-grasp domain-containing protein [Algibacter sp. L1A34]
MLQVVKECILYGIDKQMLPTDYFRKYLYRKDVINYKNYLSLKEFYQIIGSRKMVFPEVTSILANKLSFYNHCVNLNIPTPTLISYNFNIRWFCNNEIKIITSKESVLQFFQYVFRDSQTEILFLKPTLGEGGQGCFLLKKENLESQIESIYSALISNSYVHQAYVEQHDTINGIFSNSVNTIRIDTYIDINNEAHVLSALMRFGMGNTFTDNTHTGGFYISLNLESGKLQGVGRQDIVEGGKEITHHPNSQVVLDGFQIPFYKEAFQLALKASNALPNRIVGWDVAITDQGPILLEGNESPSLHVTDVACSGYLNNKYIKEILLELKK